MQMLNFKMLSQSNGLWLLFEYQWPCTEKVQGCSLTSLCLSSAASDPTENPVGIITDRAAAWELVRARRLLGGFQGKLTRRQ